MKVLVLFNPRAGGGKTMEVLRRVRLRFAKEGLDWDEWPTWNSVEDREPDWSAYSRAILIGGDGTLHRLLNTWGSPPLPLALISGGSGNDFSRQVQQSRNPDTQLDQALNGREQRIDLGICNGVWFATGLGIGFDGSVAALLHRNSRLKGFLAYYLVVLLQILRYREKAVHIQSPGFSWSGKSLMFTVGNGSDFGGGFKVTPDADFRDGTFQCCLIGRVPLLSRFRHLPKVQAGKHRPLPFVRFFNAPKVRLQSPCELPCHMDGEVYRWKDFEVEIRPGALRVLSVEL